MTMTIIEEPFPGTFVLGPTSSGDSRGVFVKPFNVEDFQAIGIQFTPAEIFYSISVENVIRGLHFQLPPFSHDKLVFCVTGSIRDVIVDLRKKSSTFGRVYSRLLSGDTRSQIFVPRGVAHGFLSLAKGSIVAYTTSSIHNPRCDTGIRWDGIAFNWGVSEPIVSQRDRSFPALSEFDSPF